LPILAIVGLGLIVGAGDRNGSSVTDRSGSPWRSFAGTTRVTVEGRNINLCRTLKDQGAGGCDRFPQFVLQVNRVISGGQAFMSGRQSGRQQVTRDGGQTDGAPGQMQDQPPGQE